MSVSPNSLTLVDHRPLALSLSHPCGYMDTTVIGNLRCSRFFLGDDRSSPLPSGKIAVRCLRLRIAAWKSGAVNLIRRGRQHLDSAIILEWESPRVQVGQDRSVRKVCFSKEISTEAGCTCRCSAAVVDRARRCPASESVQRP